MNPSNSQVQSKATDNFYKAYGGTAPENYEKYFVPVIGGPLAKELIEIAAIREGESVLDVACGTGIVARLAAERASNSGRVAAVDINPGMLNVARSTAAEKSIEWYESNAENIPLPDETFDVVLSQLGLQFFQDPLAGLREMKRVLRPTGRLLIRTVGPTPELFTIFDEALARHISPQLSAFVQKVFSLHDKEQIFNMLNAAGFRDISILRRSKKLRLPSPKEFLWQYVHSTPLAEPLSQVDDSKRSALEKEVVAKWQKFVENDTMMFDVPDVLATAHK
jgi:ubiquinone/menaquinone biosynthesis C-methylase UbiE